MKISKCKDDCLLHGLCLLPGYDCEGYVPSPPVDAIKAARDALERKNGASKSVAEIDSFLEIVGSKKCKR